MWTAPARANESHNVQITQRILGFWLLFSSSCGSSPANGSPASGGAAATAGGGSSLNVSPGACPDAGSAAPTDAGASACLTAKPRSFTRDVVPLFNSCAGEVCHSFGAGAIAQQVGIPSVECCGELQMIEPGHPERSYVLQKLRGNKLCGGSQMPLDQLPFNADDLQVVSDWICQGAGITP
jgi:hypothetical protein